jgi:hypothetical protein
VELLRDQVEPKAWKTPHRFLFIWTRVKQQHKEPIQLDLFVPHDYGYEFKVVLTNKPLGARRTLVFHNGPDSRGSSPTTGLLCDAAGSIPSVGGMARRRDQPSHRTALTRDARSSALSL